MQKTPTTPAVPAVSGCKAQGHWSCTSGWGHQGVGVGGTRLGQHLRPSGEPPCGLWMGHVPSPMRVSLDPLLPGVKPTARGDQDLPKAELLTSQVLGRRRAGPGSHLRPSQAWSEASWLGLAPCPALCPAVGVEIARMSGMGSPGNKESWGRKVCALPSQAENRLAQASCIQHYRHSPGCHHTLVCPHTSRGVESPL